MGKRADPHRARGSALCGQWLLLDRKHHETGSALARLCTGSVGTRLGAVGGIKRLSGDKVCENSVLHSWTPFLVGNSQRRFPLPLYALTMYHRVPMSGKAVGHGGPVFWARVSEGRMGQGGTLFHKGVTTRDPRAHGSPRVPRNLSFHFLGEHVFPRGQGDRMGPGKNQNLIMGTRFEK